MRKNTTYFDSEIESLWGMLNNFGIPKKLRKPTKKQEFPGPTQNEADKKAFLKTQLFPIDFPEDKLSIDALCEVEREKNVKLEQEFDSMFGTSFFLI